MLTFLLIVLVISGVVFGIDLLVIFFRAFWQKKLKKNLIVLFASGILAIISLISGVTLYNSSSTSSSSSDEYYDDSDYSYDDSDYSDDYYSDDETSSSTTVASTDTTSETSASSTTASSSINTQIADSLAQDQGFALGTLDENGNATTSGTPNSAFTWATTVDSISYENKLLTINVNSLFSGLDTASMSTAALSAQNAAVSIISVEKDWSMEKSANGVFTQIYYDGNLIGSSKMTNVKEFKWNN